jgi:hypothetical protein
MKMKRRPAWAERMALFMVIASIVLPYGLLMLRFSLRNDETNYFLPFRMYMRDAFVHHQFMLWNPYMSFGYPAHCDMQGSVWNPIATFFCLFFNYNATTLSIELLVYYLIGAIGCFYFARNFSRNWRSCVVVAVIYGCGGFAVSILEFMSWVGSFAFLPWAVHFFYLLLTKRSIGSSIGLAVSLWLMLVCGYPSFLIYLGYCLLLLTAVYLIRLLSGGRGDAARAVIGMGLLSGLFVVLLSLPALRSFYEYLPYYTRGKRALDVHLNSESFSWKYVMSLLFPVGASLQQYYNNLYIGLVPLLVLCGFGWRSPAGYPIRRSFRDWVLLPGVFYTILFTLGRSTPVRMWSARHLSYLDAFGFSHSVRVFILIAFIVWMLPKLDILFSDRLGERVWGLRRSAAVAAVVLGVYLVVEWHQVYFRTNINKVFYCVSAIWQLGLLLLLCFPRWMGGLPGRAFWFVLADLIVSVLMTAPLTGFSLTPPGVYNRFATAFYGNAAEGSLFSPEAKLRSLRDYDRRSEVNAFKIPGRPVFPSNTRSDLFFEYMQTAGRRDSLLALPFVFADNGLRLAVRDIRLGYNFVDVDVEAADSCHMVFQETYYSRWKAVDPGYSVSAYRGVLLQVPLRAGRNHVQLYYYKSDLEIEAAVSIMTLLLLGGVVFRRYQKNGV